ncbi:TMEM165/GDT1 family protein [Desertifilum sp. FACHB-1129]|uniref:GDT1 family protein n=2 Tax=Desertifilum tharense IPPAS B-1220 TaxID=1781255 RepID=A0A1E5QJ91_9CYAN|nr:TMEM165/GDT1 family protein [Desertifilum sp. FACHB-1129]MBD2322118.1 TMEM165/GDT1 family protein [Desertifilum sp. FACHB-866]MBD2333803.1 TMEM165/GDT1 family protein [Desertifilum sp. FACHB-868]OEJ74766.1 hypothetical protein BH720_12865 [Desertifilum tharense IPPAS B-1220]
MKVDSPIAISSASSPLNSPFPASNQSDRPIAQPRRQGSGFQVFVSTFITIFLAELGDKTQLTTLLMSAESEAPWVVFMGAACALIATSLIGVLLGRWLSRRLSPQVLETASGAILLGISVLLLWDVVNL